MIAVWGVGHVAAFLDGHLEPTAQALGDDLVLPAGDEGLQFGVFLVDLIGEVVDLLRGDDESAGLPEGVQDDALILHAAAGKPVQIHAQHRVIVAVLHVLQEPEHLGPGVEGLAADHLWVLGQDVDAVGGSVVIEGLLMLGQYLISGQALLHAGLAQVDGGVQAGKVVVRSGHTITYQ